MNPLSALWERISFPWSKWQIVVQVEAADEIPIRLPVRGAALVSQGGRPTWLAFDCPCGMGHRIMLNLDRSRRPTWRLISQRPLTVSPSIDDEVRGRRCHFFLQKGRVFWARRHERVLA